MQEISYVFTHLDDVEADFLRFYNIDLDEGNVEIDIISSARVYRLASRLFYYEGAMAGIARQESEKTETRKPEHLQGATIKEVELTSIDDLPANSMLRMAAENK